MDTPAKINEEYDIIIAGGGSAGCVVAGRLAAADPNLRILVLEAGPTTYNDPAHTLPSRLFTHFAPGSRTMSVHTSQPCAALGGRSTIMRCGQCLGGGGSINFMMYNRASASDYDDWETEYQNPGWGSYDLIPLLKKTETYQVTAGGPTHGANGPLKVSEGGLFTDLGQQFLDVSRSLDPDRALAPSDTDTNDLSTINVYARWPKCVHGLWGASYESINVANRWIDAETGNRSDVPHHMIYPLKETRPNLHILTGVHVQHVTFDSENCATGVAFIVNPLFHLDGPKETRTVRGTKLVVLSAGSFGTPGILERSGIGSKGVLERVGVEQCVELPGVGGNYQDHNNLFVPCFAADEAQAIDAISVMKERSTVFTTAEFAKTKKSLLAYNGVDAGIKWRPNPSELAELGPEFKEVWDSYFANAPDKPVLWIGIFSALIGHASLGPPRKYFTVAAFTIPRRTRTRAHHRWRDVSAPIDFVPGYLESMADVKPLMWGYKFVREIARRMPHFRGEPAAMHPAFNPSGTAAIVEHAEGPIAFDAAPIAYSEEDERALEAHTRAKMDSAFHALGTCAMKSREQGGVVDSRLNVYGVRRLKLADLSIAPGNVAANTYSTALVIGEKAAVIIAEELGIMGVV
ncbi:alcohol oxidase-like protein [Lactifluus subvellereus]|nr:alcohol oxidase-like protein [Lactifluus subvellereus]